MKWIKTKQRAAKQPKRKTANMNKSSTENIEKQQPQHRDDLSDDFGINHVINNMPPVDYLCILELEATRLNDEVMD